MRLAILGALAAFLATVPVPAQANPHGPPGRPSSPPTSDSFTFSMYGALKDAQGDKGNIFFSGTSLRDALGQAYLGARGDTAKEMARALALDPDPARAAVDAKNEASDWASAKGKVELRIANRLWADASLKLDPTYAAATASAYGATVAPVDFRNAAEPARLQINGWVEKQTNERIKDLIPSGALDSLTRLVITNAVYFDGKWAHPFDKAYTRPAAFAGTSDVPTMHQTASFQLAKADGMTMLEMPYQGSDLVMDVILPDAQDGLPAVEAKLSPWTFGTWTKALKSERVAVAMPKVKYEWGGSVAKPLGALGMKKAFSHAADFSGIADKADLHVSDVIHKAFVAIDEEGTEAAAASAVVIATRGMSIEPPAVPFKADHPFVFVIRDKAHDRILFMGRVTNPKV